MYLGWPTDGLVSLNSYSHGEKNLKTKDENVWDWTPRLLFKVLKFSKNVKLI